MDEPSEERDNTMIHCPYCKAKIGSLTSTEIDKGYGTDILKCDNENGEGCQETFLIHWHQLITVDTYKIEKVENEGTPTGTVPVLS